MSEFIPASPGGQDGNAALDAAVRYLSAGLSVIPIRADGSKQPATRWKDFQTSAASAEQVRSWFSAGRRGIALVCGAASGMLECLDFDDLDAATGWEEIVRSVCPDLLARLVIVKTPRPGLHVWYRVDSSVPGNQVIATAIDDKGGRKTLIETRGHGGYALVPGGHPDAHPAGRPYELVHGSFDRFPVLTTDERTLLHELARSLGTPGQANDESPDGRNGANPAGPIGERPGDVFERDGPSWREVLEPHGWQFLHATNGVEYLRRPGKDGKSCSATLGHCRSKDGLPRLYVFSSSASPFEAGHSYSKFAAFTLLEHAGDFGAAARALASQGHGSNERCSTGDDAGDSDEQDGRDGQKKKRPSAAEELVSIALANFDLWHDPSGDGFASRGRESYPIRGKQFRKLLVGEYLKRTASVPNGEALGNAVSVIDALATIDGPECEVFVRIGQHADRTYLFLGDQAGQVVEIDAEGWRLCDRPPVRFVRPSSMRALPVPERGGDLDDLRRFINVGDDDSFALLLGWLAASLQADAPCPALVLTGEQGSAKSTTARVLKALIDQSAGPLRSEARDPRDLQIASRHSWLLCFDNLGRLTPWLSDCLCRLATGGGFATRELYSDSDEVIFDARRPVVLNGIEDIVSRPDLLERAVLLRHPAIAESKRRLEADLWAEFERERPRLLGALLDRLSAGLRQRPAVQLDRLPRMADFARLAVACEQAAGERPTFLDAYSGNQRSGHELALEDDQLADTLRRFIDGLPDGAWQGTATELLAALTPLASDPKARDWPKRANALTGRLRRLAPALGRVHGLRIDCDAREARAEAIGQRRRIVTINPTR